MTWGKMVSPDIAQAFTYFLAMLFSLTVHEAAHALVAKWRGDRTAELEGRLTLNPMAHADILGTYVLPLIGALAQWPIIGWAKPVPVDLRNVKDPKWDHVMIALAGPMANLLLCFICVAFLSIYQHLAIEAVPPGSFFFPLVKLVGAMVWVNAILAFFNLIPLPPLDGATVISGFLPDRIAEKYDEYVRPYGFMILLMLMMSGGLYWLPKAASGFVEFARSTLAIFM